MRTLLPTPASPHGTPRPLLRRLLRVALPGALVAALVVAGTSASHPQPTSPQASVRADGVRAVAATTNPVTPGNFTGLAFDQCLAPTQTAMNRWLNASPFLGVGIYISGTSRACRNQPNLTPAWIHTQLANGWKLLPITMGPQASCNPRFPRYKDDFRISNKKTNGAYTTARTEGAGSATSTVQDARALGISAGSTLWYDLEGFDSSNTGCRESALSFVSAWVNRIHQLGYVAGVYSSASSGIRALDQAKTQRPKAYTYPDRVWIADWNGQANTSSSYVGSTNWNPGGRVKQYQGGHDETWGGVTINIDRSFLNVGTGSKAAPETHCGGVTVSFRSYKNLPTLYNGQPSPPAQIKALQCLLTEWKVYNGPVNGVYGPALHTAISKWQQARGFTPDAKGRWLRRDWVTLLGYGFREPVQKDGSAGMYVRRIQRVIDAAAISASVPFTGLYDAATTAGVRAYQKRVGLPVTGVVDSATWAAFIAGKF